MNNYLTVRALLSALLSAGIALSSMSSFAATDISSEPLYTSRTVTPLNMLVMGRDHKLYYEAYNDAADLDGDGFVDIRFKPGITYYGNFSSDICYNYAGGIFVPVSRTADAQKKCSGSAARWSGNFLNYISTSRIDALRKVLYGGNRYIDKANGDPVQTVIERSYTPQDGHSWGKEYNSFAVDGYYISDYTPLGQPVNGTRHVFANTSLNTDVGTPLIRVLNDTKFRVWEWVSIEGPVAGSECDNGSRKNCAVAAGTDESNPNNSAEFTALINNFSSSVSAGPVARTQINKQVNGALTLPGAGAASAGLDENYISVINGKLVVTVSGEYQFAVNGDDAVDFAIDNVLPYFGWYGGHGAKNKTDSNTNIETNWIQSNKVDLAAGVYTFAFRHEEVSGGDSYQLAWKRPSVGWEIIKPSTGTAPATAGLKDVQLTVLKRDRPASAIADYIARVQICKPGLLDDSCTRYVRTEGGVEVESYKPEGILQQYGGNPSPKMLFGLLSGSYKNNTRGGVVRRDISNISDEINQATGQITSVNGVIGSISKFKITGWDTAGNRYTGCGLLARPINNDECQMWGNPIAEMMYEGLRYFSGKNAPTPSFTYSTSTYDDLLGLPKPSSAWVDPYTKTNVNSCSVPIQTVISDINPSYDTDDLPGSNWSNFSSDLAGLNTGSLADEIWQYEIGGDKNIFIGETNGIATSTPTAKIAKTFKNTRGLSPEEPTKLGGYYAASVAYYGLKNDLNGRSGQQKMGTYAIALASPLPEFKIPVGGNVVTLVPFAKSVKHGSASAWNTFSPTNTIVDFYIESIADDAKSGVFRVNFEDVEQGNDHDMDAIARYAYIVNQDGTLTINMSSDYAAGGVVQHMGYVISGTTTDGAYLEVRDADTAEADDYEHPLDTLPGKTPGQPRGTGKLQLTASRAFTPSATPAASLLKDPLWYAAKWGGFNDKNDNGRPDFREEWTSAPLTNLDPNPDNYFLVTNALKLKDQLDKAFSEILRSLSSSSAAAASTGQFVQGKTQVVQARFRTSNWSGELVSFEIKQDSSIGSILWNSAEQVPNSAVRKIFTLDASDNSGGVPFEWSSLTAVQRNLFSVDGVSASVAMDRVNYIRGDMSKEENSGGIFRDRINGVIGDITNSDPVYVDNLESRLTYIPSADTAEYSTFRATLSNRPEMVYAGTNGGLLHAVCALNCGSVESGTELFAYVPGAVIPDLYELSLPSYKHRYYVDGPSSVVDAKIGADWTTVLLGSLGAGGQAVYALDVTNPASFGASNVMWEFTPESEAADLGVDISDTDLGLTIGKPLIARVNAGNKSVAIFSNGFNSRSSRASLMIVDLQTGKLIKRIRVNGAGSALSAPALLDRDTDGYVDYVYAGDDAGNLWRFDIKSTDIDAWGVDLGDKPLLVSSPSQPFTSAPTVYVTTESKVMVYAGTGKYLGYSDKTNDSVQAMYAVQDKWLDGQSFISSINTASLVQQKVEYEQEGATLADGSVTNFAVRVTSANEVDYASKSGWYINLIPPSGTKQGERITASAVVRHERLIFTTLIPPVDSCEFGGSGWLMEMDALSGQRFPESVLDLNGDGSIDGKDMYMLTPNDLSIGGRKFDELIRTPAFVGFGDKEGKYISGSSGGLTKVWEKGGSTLLRGRLSWQQLE